MVMHDAGTSGSAANDYALPPSLLKRLTLMDWLFAAMLVGGAGFALMRFSAYMDIYEQIILVLTAPVMAWMGWHWKPLRLLTVAVAGLALLGVALYGGDLGAATQGFLLQYVLASQSAILWMGVLFIVANLLYWAGLLAQSQFLFVLASRTCWIAVTLGFVGLMVRWYESYLIGTDIGYIPVANLYEVFIQFCLVTALFYLYYEERYQTRQLGAFVLLIISAAVGFIFWYAISRGGADIEPLVPALQSWWMKIHVPANFVGYGTFALAAMAAVAYLLKSHGFLANRLPSLEVIDDLMYKSIAVGFAFFTVATILGALWAAEAWGGYWSWDPKETWALIVWLNYATWLHMRLLKGLRGRFSAWWALGGLLITTFAFIGVNMFLAGLHSYGEL